LLRWNRCVRLLESIPELARERESDSLEISDTPPIYRD